MPTIGFHTFHGDGDGVWQDVADTRVLEAHHDFEAAWLDDGTVSGKPSLVFRFRLEDGSVAIAQTTLTAFGMLVAAVIGTAARKGVQLDGTPANALTTTPCACRAYAQFAFPPGHAVDTCLVPARG
jgi:hypothetical protein